MANEVCSQSLRSLGASCNGVPQIGGIGATKCRGAVASCFSSRTSWSPPATNLRFGAMKVLLQEGPNERRPALVRQTLIRAAVRAQGPDHLECGFAGDVVPEMTCDHQSTGPGSSALERWLAGYVTEIVRHLPEAPFLQLVPKYSNEMQGERQKVSEELFEKPGNWQSVNQCLLDTAPDGIILVHRLDHKSLSECCMNEVAAAEEASRSSVESLQADGYSTDVWGVLVHGCEMRCNACYILKTTQVASSTGIMTHFCVSRAKCFGPSLKSQLQRAWLL